MVQRKPTFDLEISTLARTSRAAQPLCVRSIVKGMFVLEWYYYDCDRVASDLLAGTCRKRPHAVHFCKADAALA